MQKPADHANISPDGRRAIITVGDGERRLVPMQWIKLLLRLRALPDGLHQVQLVKSGEDCQWSVQGTGKLEG